MTIRLFHRRRLGVPHRLGWLALIVGLVSQLALGAMVLPDNPSLPFAQLDAVSVLCGAHSHNHPAPVHRHRAADPALCPLSVALALPSVLPADAAGVPLPSVVVIRTRMQFAAARAPPVRTARVGSPRGPPILV